MTYKNCLIGAWIAISICETGYLHLNNAPIIFTMLNAMKELKANAERLEAENTEQKARLARIEERLAD